MNKYANSFVKICDSVGIAAECFDNEDLKYINTVVKKPGWYTVDWARGFNEVDFYCAVLENSERAKFRRNEYSFQGPVEKRRPRNFIQLDEDGSFLIEVR